MIKTCKTCKYFHSIENTMGGGDGQCRFNPPHPHGHKWAFVRHADWCRKYELKDSKAPDIPF
jgi:hypothetical protein